MTLAVSPTTPSCARSAGRADLAQASPAPQTGRLETDTLAMPENLAALADLNGQWIDRFHGRNGLLNYTLINQVRLM